MTTLRLTNLCAGDSVMLVGGPARTEAKAGKPSIAVVYKQDGYTFTVGDKVAVPDELAKYLLQPDRPCGFGVFEVVT